MRIGIDVDQVLADWNTAFVNVLHDVCPHVNIPVENPDFPKVWAWPEYYGVTANQLYEAWKRVKGSSTFWSALDPLPDAVDAISRLNQLAAAGDDIYFLTNRVGYKCKLQTERWLEVMGMEYPTVLIVSDKLPIVRTLGIHLFIDDRLETINAVANAAEDESLPVRGHVYLKDYPHNREGRRDGVKVVGGIMEMLRQEGLWLSCTMETAMMVSEPHGSPVGRYIINPAIHQISTSL